MGFRKLTISYEDFQDEERGLVRYLADAVMMLIRKNDMDGLQKLMNNIAIVSADLDDLNHEIIGKKKDYDKLMNRINALQADMAQKMAAQADLEAEMRKLVGSSEEDEKTASFDDPLAEFDQVLSELDQDFGDDDEFAGLSEITVENVIGNDDVPETFKKHGIVFGEDISRLAAAENYEIEQEDDIYTDFDLHVDVDQGYKPVDEAARSLGLSMPKDPDPIDDFDAAYSQFDDTYDDMFGDVGGDSADFFGDDYDDFDDFDDLGNSSMGSVDDMFSPAPAQEPKTTNGGGIPGVVDMDLFR